MNKETKLDPNDTLILHLSVLNVVFIGDQPPGKYDAHQQ